MWPEAAFAGDCHTCMRYVFERRGDLGTCGIELRTGPLDLAAEGPEAVGIEGRGHNAIEAKRLAEQRSDHTLLAVHRGDHGPCARQMKLVAAGLIGKRVREGVAGIRDRHGGATPRRFGNGYPPCCTFWAKAP